MGKGEIVICPLYARRVAKREASLLLMIHFMAVSMTRFDSEFHRGQVCPLWLQLHPRFGTLDIESGIDRTRSFSNLNK